MNNTVTVAFPAFGSVITDSPEERISLLRRAKTETSLADLSRSATARSSSSVAAAKPFSTMRARYASSNCLPRNAGRNRIPKECVDCQFEPRMLVGHRAPGQHKKCSADHQIRSPSPVHGTLLAPTTTTIEAAHRRVKPRPVCVPFPSRNTSRNPVLGKTWVCAPLCAILFPITSCVLPARARPPGAEACRGCCDNSF